MMKGHLIGYDNRLKKNTQADQAKGEENGLNCHNKVVGYSNRTHKEKPKKKAERRDLSNGHCKLNANEIKSPSPLKKSPFEYGGEQNEYLVTEPSKAQGLKMKKEALKTFNDIRTDKKYKEITFKDDGCFKELKTVIITKRPMKNLPISYVKTKENSNSNQKDNIEFKNLLNNTSRLNNSQSPKQPHQSFENKPKQPIYNDKPISSDKHLANQLNKKNKKQIISHSSTSKLFSNTVKAFVTLLKSFFPIESKNSQPISISYQQFKAILFRLSFIRETVNGNSKAIEGQLADSAWLLLTRLTKTQANTSSAQVDSEKALAFILCVLDLQEGHEKEFKEKYSYDSNCIQQIHTQFSLFKVNHMSYHSKLSNEKDTKDPLFKQLHPCSSENILSPIRRRRQLTASNSQSRLYDLAGIMKEKRMKRIADHQKEASELELAQCSFKPKLFSYSKSPSQSSYSVAERLYQIGQKQKNKREKLIKENQSHLELTEMKQCTFTPVLSKFSRQMFLEDPSKQGLKHQEKVSAIRNPSPAFKFDNERLHYKETFEKFLPRPSREEPSSSDLKLKATLSPEINLLSEKIKNFCNENHLNNNIKEKLEIMIKNASPERNCRKVIKGNITAKGR